MAEFALVQAAARTGTTGTQDFTSSGFGTPKGAMVWLTYATVNGTAANHAMLGVGFTDGTNHRSLTPASEDGVVADTQASGSLTTLITTIATANTPVDGSATFDSWITDGLRINWTDVPPAAYLVNVLLIGGAGVSAVKVGNVQGPAVVGNAVDVNTVGFQPDLVLCWSNPDSNISVTACTHADPVFGMAVRDGSDTQRCAGLYHQNASNPSHIQGVLDTASVSLGLHGGFPQAELQISDFDASGFSVYCRVGAAALEIDYLAIQLNGLVAKIVTSASPTGTGDHTITGAGITPQLALMVHTAAPAVNTVYDTDSAEVLGLSAITSAASLCGAIYIQDNVATANTESIVNNIAISLRKAAAAFMTATWSAWTSDGMTLNYTVTDGTARQRAVLFVQAESGGLNVNDSVTVTEDTPMRIHLNVPMMKL